MPDQGPKSGPKMRSRNNNTGTPSRPRPKTIHVDAGSNDAYNSRTLSSSKGKRGSGTNLAGSLLCVQTKLKKNKSFNYFRNFFVFRKPERFAR